MSKEEDKKKKKHKLQNRWKFWSEGVKETWSNETFKESLKDLGSFNTIEDFWEIYAQQNLSQIQTLKKNENIHLFRITKDGNEIKPKWEDYENSLGGEWVFRVIKDVGPKVWEALLFGVIGEQFDEQLEKDEICGLTVSGRPNDFVFKLWNKNANSKKKDDIFKKIQELIPDITIQTPFYKPHFQEQK